MRLMFEVFVTKYVYKRVGKIVNLKLEYIKFLCKVIFFDSKLAKRVQKVTKLIIIIIIIVSITCFLKICFFLKWWYNSLFMYVTWSDRIQNLRYIFSMGAKFSQWVKNKLKMIKTCYKLYSKLCLWKQIHNSWIERL